MAHVRHGQGERLPGRPGRHRDNGQGGPDGRSRIRALRLRLLEDPRGQDRPEDVRRPHQGFRPGRTVPQGLLRGRPHGARPSAHPLRDMPSQRGSFLQRILLAVADNKGRRLQGRRRVGYRQRRRARLPREDRHVRHGRIRQGVQDQLQRDGEHRRRALDGPSGRASAGGHGIRPVSSDRPLPAGHTGERGGARRGRIPDQRQGGEIHGEVRSVQDGARSQGSRLQVDSDGNERGQGNRRPSPTFIAIFAISARRRS